eukprot:TRINITY_DN27314_c0_g1_i1.p1 TRINITY_DN27314_c0_g1~~TRINITY_DN27314_c0_g1_i1.p1  ORF type:complete len:747 (+),score=114.21 TRINITY_DN27314_c0_g1_i1:104-2242(+)
MKRNFIMFVALFCGVLQFGVVGQSVAVTAAETGFSLASSDLSSILESSLQSQVASLESDPLDLDPVLEDVGDAIRDELRKFAQKLIASAYTIDQATVADEFGSSVQSALAPIAQIPGFEGIDSESVGAYVESQVLDTLMQMDVDSDLSFIVDSIGDAIIVAIAEGIVEVTGGEYTYEFSSAAAQPLSPQQQFYVSIIEQLAEGNIDVAYQLLQSSNVSVIVAASEYAIMQGFSAEVSQLLVNFFEDGTVPTEKLSFLIALFTQVQDPRITPILINAITTTSDVSNLVNTFYFVFTQGEVEVADSFMNLILKSIINGVCQVANIIGRVLVKATPIQAEVITLQLLEADAEACIVEESELTDVSSATTPASVSTLTPPVTLSPTLAPIDSALSNLIDEDEDEEMEELAEVPVVELKDDVNGAIVVIPMVEPEVEVEAPVIFPTASVTEAIPVIEDAIPEPVVIVDPTVPTMPALPSFRLTPVLSPIVSTFASPSAPLFEESIPVVELTKAIQAQDDEDEIIQAVEGDEEPEVEIPITPVFAVPVVEELEVCQDVVPPGEFTCAQQAEFGKCEAAWMVEGGFCTKTCDRCCEDVRPDEYSCAEQKEWGKCERQWMIDGGFCQNTCGRCPNLVYKVEPEVESTLQEVASKSEPVAVVVTKSKANDTASIDNDNQEYNDGSLELNETSNGTLGSSLQDTEYLTQVFLDWLLGDLNEN